MSSRRSQMLVLAILIVVAFVGIQVYGQVGTNRSAISGYIFGPDRRPVSQIWVELTNDVNRIVARIRTDESGRYYFRDLANGRYTIKALPLGTGLMEHSEDVELTGIGSRGQPIPDNQQKDLYLRNRRASSRVPFQNVVIYAQTIPKEVEDIYNNAVDDINKDRFQAGVKGLERAVEMFPTYFLALQKLGLMRLRQEEYDKSILLFQRALEVNSRCFDCWYGIGYSKYTLKMFADAVLATEQALIESPESFEANLLLGMSGRASKEFEKAEIALKRAVNASDGTSADAHWQLALLYGRDTNRFAEAAKELETYLKLFPDAPNKDDIKRLIKQFKDKSS